MLAARRSWTLVDLVQPAWHLEGQGFESRRVVQISEFKSGPPAGHPLARDPSA